MKVITISTSVPHLSKYHESQIVLCMCAMIQVGPSYGRKMMTGHLSSHGYKIAERRVGLALRSVHSPYHEARLMVGIVTVLVTYLFIN